MNTNVILDLPTLQSAIQQGVRPQYVFFWGHTPNADGQIGKYCLSQWYPAAFEIDGIPYPTAEHFMMAEKARLFGDEEHLAQILHAPTPKDAKALGRKVRGFDSEVWQHHRVDIVTRGNLAKFGQNADLKAYLLSTGDKILVEASSYDKIWGIGLAESAPEAQDPAQWRGSNLLGFALMRVREQLHQ